MRMTNLTLPTIEPPIDAKRAREIVTSPKTAHRKITGNPVRTVSPVSPLRNEMDLPEVGEIVWVLRDDGRTLVRPYRMRIYDRSGGEQPDGSWRLVRYRIGGLHCQYPWFQLARELPRKVES